MRIIESASPRPLNLLAVSANGLVAAASGTFGAGGAVEVWDGASGERQWHWTPATNLGLRALAFVSHDRHLLTADSLGTHLLALRGGTSRRIEEVARNGWRDAFGVAGDRVFVARSHADALPGAPPNRAALTCWTLPNFSPVWKQDQWDDGTWFSAAPCLSPDGTRLALSHTGQTHRTHFVSVYAADTGKHLYSIPTDAAAPILQLAFTADGTKLLMRTESRSVQIFDAAGGGELVHRGRSYVTGIAVHPRGLGACARTNGTVTFWDVDKREQIRTLDWKAGKLVSLAFSPDGTLGAAGTEDGKVVVWDVDV